MGKNRYQKRRFALPKEGYWGAVVRMLPVILAVGLVPLLVHQIRHMNYLTEYSWFGVVTFTDEFFLAIKSIVLTFLTWIMAGCVIYRLCKKGHKVPFAKILIPLFVYGGLAFLSACFSVNKQFSFFGGFEQFESVWVLLGYVLIVYYMFLYAQGDLELQVVTDAVCFAATVIGIIGTLQGLGYDIFSLSFMQSLIASKEFVELGGFSSAVSENVAYATLYNSNYLGVFGSFVLPYLVVLFIYGKDKWRRLWYGIAFVLVVVAMLSSRSRAGFIAAAIALGMAVLFALFKLMKKWYVAIPALNFVIVAVLLVNAYNDNVIFDRMKNVLKPDVEEVATEIAEDGTVVRKTGLTEMYTAQGGVVLEYNEFLMQVTLYTTEDSYGMYAIDNKGNQVELLPNEDGTEFFFTHPAIKDITVFPVYIGDDLGMIIDTGSEWRFVYNEEKESFQYITEFGKESDMITAEHIGFENYQNLFSGRGFIWSRTLPLLKEYVFLGSGPDTFLFAFPQEDYLYMKKHGFERSVMTKPHSWYLQVGVQTGVVSLVSLLLFYGWYAVWSLKLYTFRRLNSRTEAFGIAAFIGSIGYMISGISNDSMVVTAPVFWGVMGIGIAANVLVAKKRKEEKEKAM